MPHQYPHFIIVRDRLEPLIQLVDWLESAGQERIIFIDNMSTYPPLVEYLNSSPHKHFPTHTNEYGHVTCWSLNLFEKFAKGEYFVLTDPDVIPDEDCPLDAHEYMRFLLDEWHNINKVGFSLRIDDLPDHYPQKAEVIAHESQFWTPGVNGLFFQPIDTTFALYKWEGHKMHDISPAIRTAPPYQARHLAWYTDPNSLSADEVWYRQHADQTVTTWCRQPSQEAQSEASR